MYEGEVTELTPEYTEAPSGTSSGYGKAVSHVIIGLKTVKGSKQLKLDPTIYDALSKVGLGFITLDPCTCACTSARGMEVLGGGFKQKLRWW